MSLIKTLNPELTYTEQFFNNELSLKYLCQLKENIRWKQEHIKIFGREVAEPRLVAWHGDKPYKYSGKRMQPEPWIPVLTGIKTAVENKCGVSFNSVLLNYYRNGQDSMGWHSDDEKELGEDPVIASVSFGAERIFQVRAKADKKLIFSYLLKSGSLLLMHGSMQQYWQHQVPKSKRITGERINLTFRLIL